MMDKTPRNSALELLRIISMLMVVGLHYMNPALGGGLTTIVTTNTIVAYGFESLCITSVNCFVLITGYFMVDSNRIKLSRVLDIYLSMVFYNILLFTIACVLGWYTFSFSELLWAIFPFLADRMWFVEAYIILLCFAPFMNLLISKLSKESLRLLIVIQLMFFSIWPSFLPNAPITDHGYGVINFLTLYFIAAYIKRYGIFNDTKKTQERSVFVFCVSVVAIVISSVHPNLREQAWDYCYIFVIIASVSAFLFFLNIHPIYNKVINTIAACTFGVYLTHSSVYLKEIIYRKVMNVEAFVNSNWFILHFLICVVLQFAFFALIEFLRLKVWNKTVGRLCRNKWIRNIENRLHIMKQ